MTDVAISRESLAADLRRLGVSEGDTLYIHSSLKRVGWLPDGPATLIEALLDVLGPEGTFAVPTHTLSFPGRGAAPYRPDETPSVLGTFPEAVRRWPGACRSGHASHSSAAVGAKAAWLTENHDSTHALGENSPLARLCRIGGRILLLGVDNRVNTAIHLAESLAGMPYVRLPYDASWGPDTAAELPDGSAVRFRQREFPGCSERFELLEPDFEAAGTVRKGVVGNAPSRLIEAGEMLQIAVARLRAEPGLLLCGEADCPCCPARRALLAAR